MDGQEMLSNAPSSQCRKRASALLMRIAATSGYRTNIMKHCIYLILHKAKYLLTAVHFM